MRFAAVASLAVVAVAVPTDLAGYAFEDYVKEFGKEYDAAEVQVRKAIFEERKAGVIEWNAAGHSWTKGINHFSDQTKAEFRTKLGYKRIPGMQARVPETPVDLSTLADEVDWRTKGVVTPVKNQGGCGSCWAFAATETIESAVAITTGKLLTLSPQNMVSCTPNPDHCGGTGGCQGATAELGFKYVQDKGISDEATEPYQGRTGTCKETTKAAQVGGYVKLPENKFAPLMDAISNVGPIAISVAADAWMEYANGVFSGCSVDATIDHGVQLVGYGTDPTGGDYWLVRNSWGASWGSGGYIQLKRFGTDDAHCGTDKRPADGTACEGGPTEVPVCGMCGILYDTSYVTNATAL